MTQTSNGNDAIVTSRMLAYPIVIPDRALKLTRRILQIMAEHDAASFELTAVGSEWYLRVNGAGKLEKLGE
jgi:hypothetical protein